MAINRVERVGAPWPFGDLTEFFRRIFKGSEPQKANEEAKRVEVERVRSVTKEDLPYILAWAAHPEVRKHLDPAPKIPSNWNDENEIRVALKSLESYYNNVGENNVAEPQNITPVAAINSLRQIVGVGTIRWRGDPYVPLGRRIASLERIIVDPDLQGKGIGTTLVSTMLELAFNSQTYRGNGASEVRLWVMTDRIARPFDRNINFVQKFGFDLIRNSPSWKKYAQDRGIPAERTEAQWYGVTNNSYEANKKQNNINPCNTVDLVLTRLFQGL